MHERDEARGRFAASRVAHLATVRPDGGPHLVPVTFAVQGDTVWWAVDAKPKRHADLQRLANIGSDPRVSLLVDHYDEDWERLWWVRADGVARLAGPAEAETGLAALAGRYPQYRRLPPAAPVVAVEVHRWRWWSAG